MKRLGLIFHIHLFTRPIVSRYSGFNTRDIIYECRCGCKKLVEVSKGFSSPFPSEIDYMVTESNFNSILKSNVKYLSKN